jgi:hypothetical protein
MNQLPQTTDTNVEAWRRFFYAIPGVGLALQITDSNFYNNQRQQEEWAQAVAESGAAARQLPDSIVPMNEAIAESAGAASAGQLALGAYNLALAGVAQLNNDVATAQQNLADAQAAWNQGAGADAKALLDESKLGAEGYYGALGVLDQVYGTSEQTQYDYNKRLEEANAEYAKSKDLDAYKLALEGIKDEFAPLDDKIKAATDSLQILTDKLDALNGRVIDVLINVQQTNGVTIPFFDPNRTQTPTQKPEDDAPYTPLPGGPLNPGMGPTTINVYNQVDSSRAAANVVDAITRRR